MSQQSFQTQLSNLGKILFKLPEEQRREALVLLERKEYIRQHNKILEYYPETGPVRRDLYERHMAFLDAGHYRERLMIAANRVGKTEGVGGYEMSLHLTGRYPSWWKGRRFDRPIKAWACGDTGKTVREILQGVLLGPVGAWGTGLIPGDSISRIVRGTGGVADTVEIVYVKHVSGQDSTLIFKSYDQRREAFQGTTQDVIWLDEEPELNIYVECLTRTMTSNGMMICTFTPLKGMSEVVKLFLPDGVLPEGGYGEINGRWIVNATWEHAPHLDKAAKDSLYASYPPHLRDAKTRGIPQLGSGAIYPIPEADISVPPFVIPKSWPRGYGMDVGWKYTAAVWGALDRETDTLYLTHAYKRGQLEPSAHASFIKAPGDWMPGFIDPASGASGQRDGKQLFSDYRSLGLNIEFADNGVESGLYSVWDRLATGRLKVFSTLTKWFQEYRVYRRDDRGRVVKEDDHLMDATRYLESRVHKMIVQPPPKVALSYEKPVSAWS